MSAIFDKLKDLPPEGAAAQAKPDLELVKGGEGGRSSKAGRGAGPKKRQKVLAGLIVLALAFAGWQQYRRHSAAARTPVATEPLLSQVDPLIQQKNWDEAAKFLEAWLKSHPEDFTALVDYGFVLKSKRDYSAAEIQLNKALELQAGSAVAHNNLGVVYGAMGRWKAAVEELEKAIALNAQYSDPVLNMAVVHERAGNLELAIQNYREYARRLPADSEMRKNLVVRIRKLFAISAYAARIQGGTP